MFSRYRGGKRLRSNAKVEEETRRGERFLEFEGEGRESGGLLSLFVPPLLLFFFFFWKKNDVEPSPKNSAPNAENPTISSKVTTSVTLSPFVCFCYEVIKKPGRKTTLQSFRSDEKFSSLLRWPRASPPPPPGDAERALGQEAHQRPLPAFKASQTPRAVF